MYKKGDDFLKKKGFINFFIFFSENFFGKFGFAHLFLCNEENPKKVLPKKTQKSD